MLYLNYLTIFKQLPVVSGVDGQSGVPVTYIAQWCVKGSVRQKTGKNAQGQIKTEYRLISNVVILKSVMVG